MVISEALYQSVTGFNKSPTQKPLFHPPVGQNNKNVPVLFAIIVWGGEALQQTQTHSSLTVNKNWKGIICCSAIVLTDSVSHCLRHYRLCIQVFFCKAAEPGKRECMCVCVCVCVYLAVSLCSLSCLPPESIYAAWENVKHNPEPFTTRNNTFKLFLKNEN